MTDTGILLVAGDGGVAWWSDRAATVPAVDLVLGPGVRGRTDPAHLDRLVSWSVEPGAAPGALAAMADPALPAVVTAARETGAGAYTLECPPLVPEWRHRAAVAAVVRWTTRPVDHGALLLDEAAAEQRLGRAVTAGRLFRLAEYALRAFGSRCRAGEIPGPAAALLAEIAPLATGHGVDEAAGDLAAAAGEIGGLDDGALRAALLRWSEETETASSVAGAATLGAGDGAAGLPPALLDPTVLPSRIIAWNGAGAPELLLERGPAATGYRVTARLAAGVDPDCREVADLLAYAAERTTGALLAVAPTRVHGHSIVADLPHAADGPGAPHCGLFAAEVEPAALRTDPVGRELVLADRYAIDAWNYQRTAQVALATVAPDAAESALREARAGADVSLMLAETAVGNARRHLTRLGATEGPVTARIVALDAYLAALSLPAATAAEPLLTELIRPERDDR